MQQLLFLHHCHYWTRCFFWIFDISLRFLRFLLYSFLHLLLLLLRFSTRGGDLRFFFEFFLAFLRVSRVCAVYGAFWILRYPANLVPSLWILCVPQSALIWMQAARSYNYNHRETRRPHLPCIHHIFYIVEMQALVSTMLLLGSQKLLTNRRSGDKSALTSLAVSKLI